MNTLSRHLATAALAIAAPSSFVGKKTKDAMNQIKPALKMVSLSGILLGSSLLLTPMAQAATVRTCPSSQTLTAFIANGACEDGTDKIYTISSQYTSSALQWRSGTVSVTADAGNIHRITYQRTSNTLPWNTNNNQFTLAYTIQIGPAFTNFEFDSISFGVDVPTSQNGIKSKLSVWTDGFLGSSPVLGTPLNVTNAGQAGPINISLPSIKTLYVLNTITRTNTASNSRANISNFTNTFTQREIPEPNMAFGILGIAGLGLCLKRKTSKPDSDQG